MSTIVPVSDDVKRQMAASFEWRQPNLNKPHITKRGYYTWRCYGDFRAGYGLSPKEAYEHYRLTYSRQ